MMPLFMSASPAHSKNTIYFASYPFKFVAQNCHVRNHADEEKQLHAAVIALVPEHESDLANRNYESALQRLAALREPVDGYFDQVMVMTEDEQVRANRLAQLGQLRSLFLDVADISCIQTP